MVTDDAARLRAANAEIERVRQVLVDISGLADGRRHYRDAEGGEGCFDALGEVREMAEKALGVEPPPELREDPPFVPDVSKVWPAPGGIPPAHSVEIGSPERCKPNCARCAGLEAAKRTINAARKRRSGELVFTRAEHDILLALAERAATERESGRWAGEVTTARESRDKADARAEELLNAIERAWNVIANAGGGNWKLETEDWQLAAATFRETYNKLVASQFPRSR